MQFDKYTHTHTHVGKVIGTLQEILPQQSIATCIIVYLMVSVVVVVVFTLKNRSDLYPVPFSFLLFKAKKRISVVTR